MEGGVSIAVHGLGDVSARPVILLHGLMSSADLNWIRFGTAARLAAGGFRCIMPDLRGHGASDTPVGAGHWAPDVMVRDMAELIARQGGADYDLCGFSLGARIVARLVADGARPRRLILAGMGLQGFTGWSRRRDFFLDVADRAGTIRHGDPAFFAAAFMKSQGFDPAIVRQVVSSFSDMPAETLDRIPVRTLVLCGRDDHDNGDPDALVAALPDAERAEIPGNHMSCITQCDFGEAILRFLVT